MQNRLFDVTALGELLIDFTENGTSSQGNPLMEANPGGAPCNVLAMLERLGKKTAFIGKVGKDMFGNQLKAAVEEVGIDTRNLIMDENVHTTLAFVHTYPDGDRDFSFYRDPGADMMLTKDEVQKELIENSRIFHFGTLSSTHEGVREATRHAIELAKEAGCIITFDPNLRPPLWKSLDDARKEIEYGMTKCDVLKISDNEVEFLFGTTDYDKGAAMIREKYNIPLVLITMGKDGSRAYYKDLRVEAAPFLQENTIETTGAGDTFCASTLNYVLEHGLEDLTEENLKELLTFANAAASLITTRKGALRVMPSRQEVLDFIEFKTLKEIPVSTAGSFFFILQHGLSLRLHCLQFIQSLSGNCAFQIDQCVSVSAFTLVGHIRNIDALAAEDLGELADHIGDIFVGNGDPSNCYAASHVTVGEVHGIFDISVFQEISQFFYRHHRAVLLGFLRGSAQVGRNKDSLAACHDGIGEVCYVFLYLAAFQRVDQRFLVYQKISGEVKKNHAVLHFRKSVSVDHLPGAVQQRNMDRNIIALAVDLIQGFAVFDRSGKIPCGVDGEIGIVSVNFHSQMGSGMATSAPMAPSPMIPSFLPLISQPANCFFCFSASLSMFSLSFCWATHSIPPTISRDARSIPASTSSFTPLALAPGVLNTTIPFSA